MQRRRFPETFDQVKTASPLKRLGALLYDFMIFVALVMVLTGILMLIDNETLVQNVPVFRSILFVVLFVFYSFFWIRSGQTLGMLAWRVRVQTPEGEHISLTQALIRFLVAGISFGCAGLGYLWMFINREKMAWPDLASGTCVVELPKPDKKKIKK